MTTRAKGKQTMLTEAERQEQYNKLREEELRCKAMQEKLRAQLLQLEKLQAPPPPPRQKEMIGSTRGNKNHQGSAQNSCRSKRSLTTLSQTQKSITEEGIKEYHHCPKSWRRCSDPIASTQQYCRSLMGSQTPKSSSSNTKPP